MTVGDRYPLTIFGRLLTCRTCGCDVDLIELPWPWIDGESYVCGPCLQPVRLRGGDARRQPVGRRVDPSPHVPSSEPPAPPVRRDMTNYDPATEPWPVGF